jgi:CHAT domain-containing protein/Tfp pilus assembly protein PilF
MAIAVVLLAAVAPEAAGQVKGPQSDQPELARSLHNLALMLKDLGNLDEARDHLERALAIYRKALGADHPELARALGDLGALLQGQGKLNEARPLFEQALAIRRKALPPGHPDLAESLSYLGGLLHRLGKLDEARALFEQALAIGKQALPPDHPDLARAHENLGLLLAAQGKTDEAWPLLAGAAEAQARYLTRVAAGSATRDHAALLMQARRPLDVLLGLAARAPQLELARAEELLNLVLGSRAISTRVLAARREALATLSDRAEELVTLRRRLADLLLQGPGKRTPQQYRDDCIALQRQIDDLERELALRIGGVDLGKPGERGAGEIAARLRDGEVLVELVRYRPVDFGGNKQKPAWGDEQYSALLLWRGEKDAAQVRHVALGPAKEIDKAVRDWRAAAQQGPNKANLDKQLRGLLWAPLAMALAQQRAIQENVDNQLRERVWAPLAKALPEKADRLIVAPDGALAMLPFGAVRLADGKYLIERFAVRYVSTGRDVIPPPLPKKKSDLALVLGDPDFDAGDGERTRNFKRAPGSAREADAVVKLLKGNADWQLVAHRGAAATEEALLAAKRPRLLYVVTQGAYLTDPKAVADPRLRSLLALAGANKWQARSAKGLSDGLLTALEVENLDLWGTELVVLSAPESALGEVVVAEGVLGLRRAFQLAGAQMVIASLWKVPDKETAEMLPDCLARWLKGAPPHEALRGAQLEMIRRLRAEAPRDAARGLAPALYWAGFICHGR